MVDTSGIHRLIASGRRRMRVQAALESATLASVLAVVAALVVVFLVRDERISAAAATWLGIGCVFIVVAGAIAGAARRIPAHRVAARIDRANNLADRLGTAYAFEHTLGAGRADHPADNAETLALMHAAMRDAVSALPRADVVAATPYRRPAEGRAALTFGVVGLAIAGLLLPPKEKAPVIGIIAPSQAARGAVVEVTGARLCGFRDAHVGADGACDGDQLTIYLGEGAAALRAGVDDWTPRSIRMVVPHEAALGETVVWVQVGERRSEPVAFEVIDPNDPRFREDPAVALADDDVDYTRDLLADLERTAEREKDEFLLQFVKEVESLLDKAEKGELSKEQLLEELARAEQKYMEGSVEDLEQNLADLQKTGNELKKEKLTRKLGEALAKGDLDKARQEMEKLAQQLENQELSKPQREKVAEALEKASEKFEERDKSREEQARKEIERKRDEVKRLKKELAEEKDEQEQKRLSKKLDKKDRELKKLEREKERRQKSAQNRSLKRLHRNMNDAAKDMRQDGEKNQRQASRKMKDVARDTGKVDSDRRKIKTQQKVASQMTDLKEALRRAKQGNRGPKDMFGKNKRDQDFDRRARGGQGSREAWKPGEGKGEGKGQQPGGKGQQPGGDSYGDGHDPDLMGDPTAKSGNTTDESVSGVHGRGPSVRETVLSAAQKGFANKSYEKVYADYKEIVEEVIRSEKVPSGYKYYVKKYFQKIKPHPMD